MTRLSEPSLLQHSGDHEDTGLGPTKFLVPMRGRGFNHQMEEQDGAFHTHTARGLRIPIMFPIRFNHRKCTYNLDPSKTKKIQRPNGGHFALEQFLGAVSDCKIFLGAVLPFNIEYFTNCYWMDSMALAQYNSTEPCIKNQFSHRSPFVV